MDNSIYNSTEDLKVTFLLGAGASCNAVPIWGSQGTSMIKVAEEFLNELELNFKHPNKIGPHPDYDFLRSFSSQMKNFGKKAVEFGSIDIYARRLYLLQEFSQLNNLKKCVSVYFDLWESGLLECSRKTGTDIIKDKPYGTIDQRYFSLLSVLLNPGEGAPRFHSNVSFVSWNYDLQLEKAYESFLPEKTKSLEELVNKINIGETPKIVHLNGYRGVYRKDERETEIVKKINFGTLKAYLQDFSKKQTDFEDPEGFLTSIKYAWEMDSDSKSKALSIFKKTNILVIIGYSFPAFNRAIDHELIKEFEKGGDFKKVIYQDPYANEDIVNSLFRKSTKVVLEKINKDQFYIPHEFLSPSKGEFVIV